MGALKPAADPGFVGAVLVTELGLQKSFLAQDNFPMHDRQRGYECRQRPQGVAEQGDPKVKRGERQVEWVAGEPKRTAGHKRGDRAVGAHVGAGAAHGDAAPNARGNACEAERAAQWLRKYQREWPRRQQPMQEQTHPQRAQKNQWRARHDTGRIS